MIHSYKISDEAFNLIVSESAHRFPNETGGILVGKVEDSLVTIEHAIGPGSTAHHAPAQFRRDGDFSQQILDSLVHVSGGEVDYVGEWHSHAFKSRPSHVDIESMKWIAANKKYAVKEPVMLLCIGTGLNCWQLSCYAFVENRLKLLKSTI